MADLLAHRQTQSHPVWVELQSALQDAVLSKEVLHLVGLNPDASVFYLDEQLATARLTVLSGSHIHPHSYHDRTLRRKFHRILHQTNDHLHDTLLVGEQFAFLCRYYGIESDVFAASLKRDSVDNFLDRFSHIEVHIFHLERVKAQLHKVK